MEISRASRWPEKTKSQTLYYPYWLAYAAGVAEARGFEVMLVDCIAMAWTPGAFLASTASVMLTELVSRVKQEKVLSGN